MPLGQRPRHADHPGTVDRDGHDLALQQRSIHLCQSCRQLADVHPTIDLADLDAHVADLRLDRLGAIHEFVGAQARAIAVSRVLEADRAVLAGLRSHDDESVAKMADGGLAALPVAADPVAGSLARRAPAQVVALQVRGIHPGTAYRGQDDRLRADDEVDPQRSVRHPRVHGVVHELQNGVDRRSVVGEQRRRETWIDPFADDARGHVPISPGPPRGDTVAP